MNKTKETIAQTGRDLLEKGLVARTWGNISCRINTNKMAISPSGLGYENMTEEDVPIYDFENDTFEGKRKPSSEKKVHSAAYRVFGDVDFVIHTHQDYATAVSLGEKEYIELTEEEERILGNIEIAEYGLPGTDKLKENVEAAYKKGAKVVLMANHGVVVLGKNKDEAMEKVELLEKVCKRTVENTIEKAFESEEIKTDDAINKLEKDVLEAYPKAIISVNDNILYAAECGGILTQLDDSAQMIGRKLICIDSNSLKIIKALKKNEAVLVKGIGCIINCDDEDDAKAMELLIRKAALTFRYTSAIGVKKHLSFLDCLRMRYVYVSKYSKQKKG